MNLKDILDLEEIKDTQLAKWLRWWITERMERKIEDVMWWNVKEHPPLIGSTEHIELFACFKDGTPFAMIFKKEELREKVKAACDVDDGKECADASIMIPVHGWIWHNFKWTYTKRNKGKKDDALIEVVHDWACRAMQYYIHCNMEDPWTLVEAYEIALSCPDIQLKECDVNQGAPRTWAISTPHKPDVYAEGINELYRKLREAREYCAILKKEPRKQRTAKEVIDEVYAIAKECPAMRINKYTIPGYEGSSPAWIVDLANGDYTAEARGAEALLKEVKAAKEYWEASQKKLKGHQATREAMEKAKSSDGEVIRVDGLDHETKELLLHFIESLTIKDASDILAREYPCSVWDELYFIREKLRKSIAEPRRKR